MITCVTRGDECVRAVPSTSNATTCTHSVGKKSSEPEACAEGEHGFFDSDSLEGLGRTTLEEDSADHQEAQDRSNTLMMTLSAGEAKYGETCVTHGSGGDGSSSTNGVLSVQGSTIELLSHL